MSDFNNSLIIINKASGPTSFDVVAAFRRATGIRKVGHTGTLDPLAEGVLLLCTNRATRTVEHFMNLRKQYEFTVNLGVDTSTLDAEGDVVATQAVPELAASAVAEVVAGFQGDYDMEPPAYSALKHNGRRAYELARAGETPKMKSRTVQIYDIEMLEFEAPLVRCRVQCSRGTYVRSLARDIGARLGVPAHLGRLVRTTIGPFSVADGFSSQQLFDGDVADMRSVPISDALDFMPGIVLRDHAKRALFDGACPTVADVLHTVGPVAGARSVRILDEGGQLLAIGNRTNIVKSSRLSWVDSYRLLAEPGSMA